MFIPNRLWDLLAAEGNFDLINKLQHVELEEDGFRTIIIPDIGFSDNDETHNLVVEWLKGRCRAVYNVGCEIERLKRSLRDNCCL